MKQYKESIIKIIRKHLPKADIYLFGSRAKKTNRPGSDIDLALDTGKPIAWSILMTIQNDLEESLIPYEIDIVDFNSIDKSFNEKIILENIRVEKLEAALKKLKLALEYYKKNPNNFFHWDPKIKRFECASDQFWNFLKSFLREKHSIEVKSPRETYRKSFTINMITEEETQNLIQMQLTRNNTVQLYSEEFTKRILPEIDEYYDLMHGITERLKKQL